MDRLYASLRKEIQVFEEQVQKCRLDFDLKTLQRALTLLADDHKEQLDNWKQIEKYVQSSSGEEKVQLHRYFSWLLSYLGYLRTMKNAFDDRIVFPLCDNLYVNNEAETTSAPIPLSPLNIAGTARQLFHHRRTWALLLSSGSLPQNHGPSGSSRPMPLLHCIPDIFEESLVTANLARNWILLHESRPSSQPQPDREFQVGERTERRLFGSADQETQSPSKNKREQMMFLLWRAGRAESLGKQLRDSKLKVQTLRQDINELTQLIQKDRQGTSAVQSDINLENQRRLEKLQRQLDLEQFHQRILNCDWQLELEVQPLLIRQINAVQERYPQVESTLNPSKEPREESQRGSAGALSDPDWDNSSVFSHSSAYSSEAFYPQE